MDFSLSYFSADKNNVNENPFPSLVTTIPIKSITETEATERCWEEIQTDEQREGERNQACGQIHKGIRTPLVNFYS